MRAIAPHRLWLGNALDARDLRRLYEAEIAADVDLAIEEKPAQLGREIVYLRIPLIDGAGNPPELVRLAVETVEHLIKSQMPTLVACGAGMSRSPAIVAAALARIEGRAAEEVLAELVAGRPHDVSPPLWEAIRQISAAIGRSDRSPPTP
jgi:protein-tyrosine phosphatase